jgi:hypothetical protein
MSAVFYLRNIDSDLSVGGALFNYDLLQQTGTAADISTGSIAATTTVFGYGFTESGIPGIDGATGNYTIRINVTTGNTNFQLAVQLNRVNSSGTVQTSSSLSAEQQGTAGVKTFNFTSLNLGSWVAGDRLRIDYRFRTTNTHGTNSLSFGTNTTDEQVDTPFIIAAAGPTLKYWNGSNWIEKPLKYWNGSNWLNSGVLKYWNGSNWIQQ